MINLTRYNKDSPTSIGGELKQLYKGQNCGNAVTQSYRGRKRASQLQNYRRKEWLVNILGKN